MKRLVYCLLLANLALFIWQYQQGSEAPPPRPQAMRPYDHVNRLLLMSEINLERLRLRTPAKESVVAAAPEQPPAPSVMPPEPAVVAVESCYSVGPLKDEAQIAAVRDWLLAMGGDPVLRLDERRELDRYWVYFPPLASKEEALREVERMRAEGLEDVIAVASGEMENAISLGVFSQRDTLRRRLRDLEARGYQPSIMPRYTSEKLSWFDVSFERGEQLTQSEVGARFAEMELREASCVSGEIARGGPGS